MTRPVQPKGTPESSPERAPETSPETSATHAPELSAAELMPVKAACERWGIKSAAFYARMKHLGQETVKQGKKAFLKAEQVALLDEFDAHIKATGSMEGFGAIVAAAPSTLEETSQAVEVEAEAAELEQDFEAIVRSAQEHAAGSLIAKYMLSAELQNRPELLPEALRAQVNTAQKKAAPKSQSPQAIAAGMISQMRQRLQLHPVSEPKPSDLSDLSSDRNPDRNPERNPERTPSSQPTSA